VARQAFYLRILNQNKIVKTNPSALQTLSSGKEANLKKRLQVSWERSFPL
jgi:hypothetical protein